MIREILENYGVEFVNRSTGMATTTTISLDTLQRAAREVEERLLQELSWKAHCVKNELEDGEFAGAGRICGIIDETKVKN